MCLGAKLWCGGMCGVCLVWFFVCVFVGFFCVCDLTDTQQYMTLQVSASRKGRIFSVSVDVFGALMGNSKERNGNG